MSKVTSLVLRRMRTPVLVLVFAYTISIVGFVLIPGVDAQGQPWRMGFFHAIYFVSYMATTIGFGELPYAFSDAQRLWTLFCIYLTVTSWLYAIGSILSLVQNPAVRRASQETAFERRTRRINEIFYLVCGYGDTGELLVGSLARRGLRAVVVEEDPARLNDLLLANFPVDVPGLAAAADDSQTLIRAGLLHPLCGGVVAITSNEQANLKIAIASRLLNPKLTVIARADSHDTEANMRSFGTHFVVNNFDESADRLAMALQSPGMFLVHEWLTGIPGQPLARLVEPQRGRWILCGYGRFGKAVASQFVKGGVSFRVIEAFPEKTGAPEGTVNGRGTEAPTLEEAGTIGATGIVAGTDNDTNNLSIIVTAQELNPELFTVARQNQRTNRELFLAAGVDLIMERTDIMAHEVLALLLTPSLESFLSLARARGADWNNQLVSRLAAILDDLGPEVFSIPISAESAPAALGRLQEGGTVPLAGLLRDPRDRERVLPVICLMLTRGEENIPLPDSDRELQPGDRLLLAGREGSRRLLESGLANPNVLSYLLTGLDRPSGSIFRALAGSR